MSAVDALLRKAERSFQAARRLLDEGDSDFAVSRAYYGFFYVAEARLLSAGLRYSRHGQVIAQYGRHFAKTGIVDARFHRLLDRAFTLRQLADYSTEPGIDRDGVEELLTEGDAFLAAAHAYLKRPPASS